jgi:hypothetical protein
MTNRGSQAAHIIAIVAGSEDSGIPPAIPVSLLGTRGLLLRTYWSLANLVLRRILLAYPSYLGRYSLVR